MLELVLALVFLPIVFGLAMMLMSLAGFAVYAPFIFFDHLLERLWSGRHPEPTAYLYTQPPAPPVYPAPVPPPAQQPVVHNHYYVLGEAQSTPQLPTPPDPSSVIEGEWRVASPMPPVVTGKDEVRRLLAAGRPARRLTRGD